MKNWGAINRRRRRRGNAQAAADARESDGSQGFRPFGIRTARHTVMEDCGVAGMPVGIDIPEGSKVVSKGLRLEQNDTGINNRGNFDGPDTVIK
jgi:hypothetical protein